MGALVRARYGDEVVDRLVDPMLGGVYAGRADRLSLGHDDARAGPRPPAPSTPCAARSGPRRPPRSAVPGRPIFAAVDGGHEPPGRPRPPRPAAPGSASGLPVRELTRTAHGWRLLLGPVPAPQTDDVDAVVLAVPARPAARLLAGVDPPRPPSVGALDYASVALVALGAAAGHAAARAVRLPGAAERGHPGQGGHVLHPQVAAPAAATAVR